jgi:hypothetical protein
MPERVARTLLIFSTPHASGVLLVGRHPNGLPFDATFLWTADNLDNTVSKF